MCKQELVHAEGHQCFCKWRSLHMLLLTSHLISSLPMVLSPSSSLSRSSVQTIALPPRGYRAVCSLSASPLAKTITPVRGVPFPPLFLVIFIWMIGHSGDTGFCTGLRSSHVPHGSKS